MRYVIAIIPFLTLAIGLLVGYSFGIRSAAAAIVDAEIAQHRKRVADAARLVRAGANDNANNREFRK